MPPSLFLCCRFASLRCDIPRPWRARATCQKRIFWIRTRLTWPRQLSPVTVSHLDFLDSAGCLSYGSFLGLKDFRCEAIIAFSRSKPNRRFSELKSASTPGGVLMHLDVIECYWRVSPLRKLSHVIVSICRKPGRIASLESFGTLELATDDVLFLFLHVFLFCNVLQLELSWVHHVRLRLFQPKESAWEFVGSWRHNSSQDEGVESCRIWESEKQRRGENLR